MKTIRKRTVLLILAALTAAGILYFAQELNWAPARQNPPPVQSESGALEKQPVMVSEHFARDEYRCDCAGCCDGFPAEPQPELVRRVEALRQAVGAPVIITSGVRCEERNAEVGGVAWSFHKRGACPTTAAGMCMWRYEKKAKIE